MGARPVFVARDSIDPFDFVRREHAARRSWLSQEQKALVIGKLVDGSSEYQACKLKIQEDANRARSGAARSQHAVSNPRAGEEKPALVVPQVEARPNRTADAKASLLEVSRPAVERADLIRRKSPARRRVSDRTATVICGFCSGTLSCATLLTIYVQVCD